MKWQTKNNGKRYVGYALFLFLSYSIGKRSGCCKYNDTAAGESGERNEKQLQLPLMTDQVRHGLRSFWMD